MREEDIGCGERNWWEGGSGDGWCDEGEIGGEICCCEMRDRERILRTMRMSISAAATMRRSEPLETRRSRVLGCMIRRRRLF